MCDGVVCTHADDCSTARVLANTKGLPILAWSFQAAAKGDRVVAVLSAFANILSFRIDEEAAIIGLGQRNFVILIALTETDLATF